MFEALQFGPFFLWTRLVFMLLGAWLAAEFFFRLAQSATLSLQHFQDKAWYYLGAFILGGRVFVDSVFLGQLLSFPLFLAFSLMHIFPRSSTGSIFWFQLHAWGLPSRGWVPSLQGRNTDSPPICLGASPTTP